jgi:hypothetical protein
VSKDLQVGLLATFYSTWLHNYLAIALLGGMVFSAILIILKPQRKLVFFLLGFLLLFSQFEYQKHFGKMLEEQTANAVILQGNHFQARAVIEDFFQKLIPFGLWFVGWGLVFLGILF